MPDDGTRDPAQLEGHVILFVISTNEDNSRIGFVGDGVDDCAFGYPFLSSGSERHGSDTLGWFCPRSTNFVTSLDDFDIRRRFR